MDGYKFGNIFSSNVNEVWNGEAARSARKSCWDGQYGYCNFAHCYPFFVEKKRFAPYYDEKSGCFNRNPKRVEIGYDTQCNVACITCRKEKSVLSKQQIEKYDSLIEPLLIPLVKDAEQVYINGNGEVFSSPHCRKVVQTIARRYPDIKFSFISNGILFNEKNTIELLGDLNRLIYAQISIHAATEETYNKIVMGGNFKQAMQNIKWLANLKRDGKLKTVILTFVVQRLNYKEMKLFLELGISLDVAVSFSDYQDWIGNVIGSDCYKDYAVFLKGHPEYGELERLLQDPVFDDPHCDMNGMIRMVKNNGKFSGARADGKDLNAATRINKL
jgi:MoaA/NifB/PqqE/SkfB family radical SAM enzyme